MDTRRVVITGLGVLSPLGNNVQTMWDAICQGKSGAGRITRFDATNFKTKFACEVKDFDPLTILDRKDARKLDRYAQYAVYVADQALQDAAFDIEKENRERMGVIFGSGMGGLMTFQSEIIENAKGDGVPHYNPFFIPKVITNVAAGLISIRHGLQGINYATNSACASATHAIADAFNYIRWNKADVILAGGSEAPIAEAGIGGFNSLHAISTRNESPETASRPYSASRDGFVLGEGAACLVLEEYEHARARGAKIYAEIVGSGMTADAYHMTQPDPTGNGAARVMKMAIDDADIQITDIDYINTHGTSTPLGDVAEIKAIQDLFGEHAYNLNISSTKSMTGHLLGATGAIEGVITVLALRDGIVPPTINHEEGDDDENIDYRLNFTFNKAQHRDMQYALSNTFGFGGHNATILFKKF